MEYKEISMTDVIENTDMSLRQVENYFRSSKFDIDNNWLIIEEWTNYNFRGEEVDAETDLRLVILIIKAKGSVEILDEEKTITMDIKKFTKEWIIDHPLLSSKQLKNKYLDVVTKNKRVSHVKTVDQLSYIFSDFF